ncbi:MAG: hypothetical protein OXQ89_02280 [Rhodospirillaceae bacterium]|nr:hypothetical protein [Rhodospirillaceae bacterium]
MSSSCIAVVGVLTGSLVAASLGVPLFAQADITSAAGASVRREVSE